MVDKASLRQKLGVYVVTDNRNDVSRIIRDVEEAVRGGATTIQLRRKNVDGGPFVELGFAIRKITAEYKALYIVNDRVDVALITEADGVHVGQTDISFRDAKRLLGNRIVGVSVSNINEAHKAIEDGADYLGVGSVYPTSTKGDAELCPPYVMEQISHMTDIPIVAIGGITYERVPELLAHGASGIAVVSAVMGTNNPRREAERLASYFATKK